MTGVVSLDQAHGASLFEPGSVPGEFDAPPGLRALIVGQVRNGEWPERAADLHQRSGEGRISAKASSISCETRLQRRRRHQVIHPQRVVRVRGFEHAAGIHDQDALDQRDMGCCRIIF